MADALVSAPPIRCSGCGTETAPSLVACPGCRRLVHGDELRKLAAEAEASVASGDLGAALASWRRALELLPSDSRQHATIRARIDRASAEVTGAAPTTHATDGGPAKAGSSTTGATGEGKWGKKAGPLGLGGALAFLLTKAKLLLLGFTKMGTLLTMLLSFGVYWTAFGWKYGLGLVLSIYVHEMGHVAALRQLGIAAHAPMFIPGFGAIVRLKQYPATPREDGIVGLAGPIWGLGAALVALAAARVTGAPSVLAIAQSGAFINLFNLVPVWQLDGSRGLRALTLAQRWMLAGIVGVMWGLTREGMLALVGIVIVAQAFRGGAEKPDWGILARFAVLVVALGTIAATSVPGGLPSH